MFLTSSLFLITFRGGSTPKERITLLLLLKFFRQTVSTTYDLPLFTKLGFNSSLSYPSCTFSTQFRKTYSITILQQDWTPLYRPSLLTTTVPRGKPYKIYIYRIIVRFTHLVHLSTDPILYLDS